METISLTMAKSPSNTPDKGKKGIAAPGEKRQSDLKLISVALSVFGISLLLSAGMVYLTNENREDALAQLNSAKQLNSDAQQKLSRTREEEREIHEYLGPYENFQKVGIVGEERRLDWIEALQEVHKTHKLFPISYEFFPRQSVQLDSSINAANMELLASRIVIKADLLHEGDLINLLTTLRQAAHGFIGATDCALKRRNIDLVLGATLDPQIDSECTLHWLTLGERSNTPAENPPAQ